MLPFRENIHALSVPMPNQVTERALRALARASEVVLRAEGVVNLLTGVVTKGVARAPVGLTRPWRCNSGSNIEKIERKLDTEILYDFR